METLVIDRKKWLRGTGQGVLRNHRGMMCCLGFEMKRRGYSDVDILDKEFPSDAAVSPVEGLVDKSKRGIFMDTSPCIDLAGINDTEEMAEPDREREITENFKRIGVRVKFIN